MEQNDQTISADVDRAFSQLELALSGEVQPDEVDENLGVVDAVELLVIGGTLLFLNWAIQKILARLEKQGCGS